MYTLAQTRIATSLPKNPLSTSPTLFSSISQQFSRKFKHNHQLLLDISLALTTYFLLNNPISADCGSPILSGGTTHRTRLHLGYNIPSFRDFCNRYFMLSDSNECAETSHLESLQTIYDAIKQDDVPTLWKLLEEHSYDLNNIRNSNGRTPLSAAVTSNSLKMASYLCSLRPVKLDHKDDEGQTALHYACNFGQVKAAKLLIQAGADVNVKNNEGMTPLIIVAYNGFVSLSTLLLKHGKAKINSRDSTSKSALMMASYAGHFGVVEALIKYKASVDLTDKFGWSALMLAAFSGQHAICSRLLTAGADPSIEALNGKTALDLAFSAGQTKTARLLSKYIKKNNPSFSNKDFTAGTSYGELSIDHPEYSAPSQQRPQQERTNSHINKEFSSSLSDTMQKAVPGYNDPLLAEPDPPSNTYMLQTLYTPAQPHRPPQLPSFSPFVQRMSRSLRRRTLKTLPNRSLPNASRREARDHPNMKTSWDDQLNRDDSPRTSKWRSCSQVLTFCCCNVCLKSLWKMNNPDIIQAWREKAALCLIIILISGFLGFVTFGFAQLVCTKNVPIFPDDVLNRYGPDSKDMQLMIVRGRLYNVRDYFKFQFHRPILPLKDEDLQPLIESLIGKDVSDFFPSDPERSLCKKWPMKTPTCQLLNKDSKLHCHTSRNARRDLEELSISNYVAFSWSRIKDRERKLFVYNEKVYSLEKYLSKNESYFGNINEQLMRFVGRDATLDILRDRNLVELIPCFNDQLLVGKVDGTTLGCFASNVIVITCSTVLFCIIFFKYVCSVLFSWIASRSNNHKSPKTKGMGDMDKSDLTYIIMLVTCYSESEKSIRATLDSLALSTYDDSHKLLFIVCDGDVTGSGNDRSTPDIALSMLEPLDLQLLSPEPMPYISIGQGSKRKNMAKVHVGFYCCQGRRVPMVIVTKCGVGVERKKPKAGNRGKRDSQLILIQWLSKICINGKLTPLEFELFEKIGRLMETSPDKFEIVLMVDADTYVEPDSVTIMVDAMNKDPMVMGLCGETKVANKRKSWVTMIQVYEYYTSHHLGKAFESIFGGVTCLPGCFCMYRIKAPKQDNQSVPILANPEIVFAYSTNVVDTLHKKNLLLLGEDRYLTTLMLRTFPKRKLIFVSKAVCKTAVPEDFKVLLSQRRRWINSTVHNLLELMLVSELCGIFCCSMQFFVTMELIQTITMPSSCILLMYLIVKVASGADVLLPLIFLGSIFLLQSVVILLTTRKFIYLLWMIVFILATPVWNLILPIYAFWHFDDFSWGATRKLSSNVKGESQTEEEDIEHLDNEILEKYWTEWKDEMGTSAQPHKAIQNCDPLSNQVMLTHAPQPRISPVYNASEASPQSPIRFDVPFLHNHPTNETQHAEYLHKSSHRASAFHRLSQPISTYMPGFTSNHYPQFSDPSSSTNNSVTLPTRALNRRSRLIGPRAMSTPSSPRHYDYLSWNPS